MAALSDVTPEMLAALTPPPRPPRRPVPDYLRDLAEEAFRHFLSRYDRPPHLQRVTWRPDPRPEHDQIEFEARFAGPIVDWRWVVHAGASYEVPELLAWLQDMGPRAFHRLYDEMAHRHLQRQYEIERAERLANPAWIGFDRGAEDGDMTAISIGVADWRAITEQQYLVEAPNMTAIEVDARCRQFVEEIADRLRQTFATEPAPATTLQIADLNRAMRMLREQGAPESRVMQYQRQREELMRREMMEQRNRFHADFGAFGTAILQIPGDYGEQHHRFEERAEAEARGLKLLKEWLSPEQLAQFESHGDFEVIGGATGQRYRIRRDPIFNVDLLDAGGLVVRRYCFLPEGGLVLGDQMLAQKVALETHEQVALMVANRQEVSTDVEPGRVIWIEEIAEVTPRMWDRVVGLVRPRRTARAG